MTSRVARVTAGLRPAAAGCLLSLSSRDIIERFGLRAFRRPLEAAEVERYLAQYDHALAALALPRSSSSSAPS